MHQNGIHAKGIEALADSFSNNLGLRIINLSDNTFTTVGAKAIAKVERISFASKMLGCSIDIIEIATTCF